MDDSYAYLLNSRTVFWEDIGLPKRHQMPTQLTEHLADFWDLEVGPWLKEFIRHEYHEHDAGVWFANRMDAIHFMLVWNGRMNL